MRETDKKEYKIVFLIIIGCIIIGLYLSSQHPEIITKYPDKQTLLDENDFLIQTQSGPLLVGQSSWEEVKKVFPEGKTLGMSTVYHPNNVDCILTFTKKENILSKMDISSPDIATKRGIKVSDSFDSVEAKYGPDYILSYDKNEPKIFDAIYGSGNYIVFKIKNDTVQKVILQHNLR